MVKKEKATWLPGITLLMDRKRKFRLGTKNHSQLAVTCSNPLSVLKNLF
jgi:hypothetical protein